MKKLLAIILVLTLSLGLCACGGTKDSKQKSTPQPTTSKLEVEQKIFSSKAIDVVYKGIDNDKIVVEMTNKRKGKVYASASLTVNNIFAVSDKNFTEGLNIKGKKTHRFEFPIKGFGAIGVTDKSQIKSLKVYSAAFDYNSTDLKNLVEMEDSYVVDDDDLDYRSEVKDDSQLILDKEGVKIYFVKVEAPNTKQDKSTESKAVYTLRIENSSDKIVAITGYIAKINGKKTELSWALMNNLDKNETILDAGFGDREIKASDVKDISIKYNIYKFKKWKDVDINNNKKRVASGWTKTAKVK